MLHTCEDMTATPCDEDLATLPLIHLDKGPYVYWYCNKHGHEHLRKRDTWRAGPTLVEACG